MTSQTEQQKLQYTYGIIIHIMKIAQLKNTIKLKSKIMQKMRQKD